MKQLIEEYNSGRVDAEDIAWEATKQGYNSVPKENETLFYKEDQLVFSLNPTEIKVEGTVA